MTAEAELDRRVTRVENEVVHIYDLLDERTRKLTADVNDVRTTLAEHSATLAEHGATLAEHGVILAEILRRLPEPTA